MAISGDRFSTWNLDLARALILDRNLKFAHWSIHVPSLGFGSRGFSIRLVSDFHATKIKLEFGTFLERSVHVNSCSSILNRSKSRKL